MSSLSAMETEALVKALTIAAGIFDKPPYEVFGLARDCRASADALRQIAAVQAQRDAAVQALEKATTWFVENPPQEGSAAMPIYLQDMAEIYTVLDREPPRALPPPALPGEKP